MNTSPCSQFDSKGRCVRHPSVQMCRRKLGGGWKTLTSICAMCAMESLRPSPDGDVPRRPLASSSHYYHQDDVHINIRNRHRDDSSVDHSSVNDQSILSAPAAYHRLSSVASPPQQSDQHRRHRAGSFSPRCQLPRQDEGMRPRQETIAHHHRPQSNHPPRREQVPFMKQPSSGYVTRRSFDSESSCDLTADMYASDVNSYGSSSHGGSSSISSTSVSCSRNAANRVPTTTSTTHPRAAAVAVVPRDLVEPTEDSYVCGMEYEHGTYYTGQIDVITRLPHGLGTLRRGGCVLSEGEWHRGTLIAPVTPPRVYSAESSRRVDDEDEDERYRLPTTDDEQDDDDDDASSISSAPTDGPSAYSARESKPSIMHPTTSCHRPSSNADSIAINGTRATFDRLQDYERYVDKCDEEGDWYHPNVHASHQTACHGDYDRVRRVRFLGDP